MEDTTLLQYLASPNPILDCTNASIGANTLNAKWNPINTLTKWTEFNYANLMLIFGRVLQQPMPPPPNTYPPLSNLETQIFTERTFETVLERTLLPEVCAGLRIAWLRCYPNDGPQDIAEIAKGDKARRGTIEEDDRYYSDWAGIRQNETTSFGYKNICPGETKLASKWSTSSKGQKRLDYLYPFSQIQAYCGRQWGCRYGYIITPEELVVVRVSREQVGSGLAAFRSVREVPRQAVSHSRTFSSETVRSELQAISLDTGSAFSDDANPNIEYGPLSYMSVPWHVEGDGILTIKLSLWWLHMLSKHDVSIDDNYQPLAGLGPLNVGMSDSKSPPDSVQDKKTTQNQNKGTGKEKG